MKVNGPGQPPTSGVPDPDVANKADQISQVNEIKTPGGPIETGKSFAERVSRPGAAEGATAATPARTVVRAGEVVVSDLASELRAGKLTPSAAVDKVVDRIVARQLGPEAPTAVRDQVRSALRDAVENDPLLAEKLGLLE